MQHCCRSGRSLAWFFCAPGCALTHHLQRLPIWSAKEALERELWQRDTSIVIGEVIVIILKRCASRLTLARLRSDGQRQVHASAAVPGQ